MTPLSIEMQGLTCYREPMSLDLSALPKGLIAVVGPNGAGKTTLLEAMCPIPLFRRFATRAGSIREHCNGKAELSVSFLHDARHYQTRLIVDPDYSAGRGKTEAYLEVDGVPLVSGRCPDYDAEIARLFPSQPLLLSSVFAAQGGVGGWASLPVADRRRLFGELLGLGELAKLSERAKGRRKRTDEADLVLEREREALAADRERMEQAAGALTRAEGWAGASSATLADAAAELEAAVEAHAVAKRDLDQIVQTRQRATAQLRRLQGNCTGLALQLQAAEDAVASDAPLLRRAPGIEAAVRELTAARARVAALVPQLAEANGTAHKAELDSREHQQRVERITRRLAEQAPGRPSPGALAVADDALAAARAASEEAEQLATTLHGARAMATAANGALAPARERARMTTHSVEQAERDEQTAKGVPCGDSLPSCRYLKRAHMARESLPRLRGAADDANNDLARDERHAANCSAEVERLAERHAELVSRADVAMRARDLAHVRAAERIADDDDAARADLAAKLAALGAPTAEIADRLSRSRAVAVQLSGAYADARGEVVDLEGPAARLGELRSAQGRAEGIARSIPLIRASLDQARSELDQHETPPDPTDQWASRNEALGRVSAARSRAELAQQDRDEANGTVAGLKARIEGIGDLGSKASALDARGQLLGMRASGFRLIERGLGREGVQALEIDAAGPEVSRLVGELLAELLGDRFTVDLRTVRAASGARKQREVLGLVVHDGRDGGTRPLEALSGGESVVVGEALKLGLALFNSRRAAGWRTLWRDECDGALSEEVAARYPAMLRRGLELGGFERAFFVTHRRAVWEQADAIIEVGPWGVRV